MRAGTSGLIGAAVGFLAPLLLVLALYSGAETDDELAVLDETVHWYVFFLAAAAPALAYLIRPRAGHRDAYVLAAASAFANIAWYHPSPTWPMLIPGALVVVALGALAMPAWSHVATVLVAALAVVGVRSADLPATVDAASLVVLAVVPLLAWLRLAPADRLRRPLLIMLLGLAAAWSLASIAVTIRNGTMDSAAAAGLAAAYAGLCAAALFGGLRSLHWPGWDLFGVAEQPA